MGQGNISPTAVIIGGVLAAADISLVKLPALIKILAPESIIDVGPI